MKPEVHRRLRELSQATGFEYGKLVQKLLALAFLESGAAELVERSTQGIDLEVMLAGDRLALEVKTTESGTLELGVKDLEGLAARAAQGMRPYVAALGPRLLDDWLFARVWPGELRPKVAYRLVALRPYRDPGLAARVADSFAAAVLAHAQTAATKGQAALDVLLRAHGAYRRA